MNREVDSLTQRRYSSSFGSRMAGSHRRCNLPWAVSSLLAHALILSGSPAAAKTVINDYYVPAIHRWKSCVEHRRTVRASRLRRVRIFERGDERFILRRGEINKASSLYARGKQWGETDG